MSSVYCVTMVLAVLPVSPTGRVRKLPVYGAVKLNSHRPTGVVIQFVTGSRKDGKRRATHMRISPDRRTDYPAGEFPGFTRTVRTIRHGGGHPLRQRCWAGRLGNLLYVTPGVRTDRLCVSN